MTNPTHGHEPLIQPLPTVRDVDGRLVIDWPDPRPRQFPITAELFEQMIEQINAGREYYEIESSDG